MEIDFLIQILNDWLEDCVECLVSPEKIIKLFSNKLDPIVFEKHINNYNQLNQEQKNEISNKIKFNFSVIEYEVLIAITNFCQEIPPKTPEEEFYYERMLDRISLSITGINLEKINFQFQQNRSKFSNIYLPFEIRFLIQGFKLIIEYFSKILKCNFFHKNNDQNENILQHNNNNHFSGLNENYKIAMESHVTGPSKRINSNLTLNSKFIQFIENHPSQVPQKKIRVRDEEKNCSPYFLINRKVDSKGIRTQHEESIIEDSNQTQTLFSQISSKKNNFIPEGEGPNENNQSFDHHEYYKKCFEGNSRPVSSKIIKKYSSSSINSLTKLNNIAYIRNSKKLCKPNSTILEESDNINNKILFGNESPERNYNISILQDNNYNRTPLRRPSCGSISSSIHYSLQYPNYYERKLIDKNFNSRQNLAKSSDHIKGYLDDDYLFLERLKICQSNKDVRVTQNQGIENYLLKNVKVNRFVTSDIYNDI